jgi:hypothetical protein
MIMPKLTISKISPQQMRQWSRQLDRFATSFSDLAREMEEDGIEDLSVTRFNIGVKSLEWLNKFASSVHHSKHRAMIGAGKYGPEHSPEEEDDLD